jgi:hypothetical protein
MTYSENGRDQWDQASLLARKNSEQLVSLRGRWEDEQEYENFDEYIKVITALFPGFELFAFKKSKFSFKIKMPRPVPDMIVRVGLTQVTWKMDITKEQRASIKK